MYGAMIGDIAGSRFEFDRGPWSKEFDFFGAGCYFTDDTVMTIAVAEALLNVGKDASLSEIQDACINSMQRWGRLYPNAGYGARFYRWIHMEHPKPYGSWGNGSAMRVSAVGWLYDSLERTREVARATAAVTHDHPEGVKGAECTAAVIYLARTGSTKEEIEAYVSREFGYDLSESLEELRSRHHHDESCMDSLPKALRSFLDGESYEDTVRNAISLGGDTDTIAAIAGAMAEAFFRIPAVMEARGKCFLDPLQLEVLQRFDRALGRVSDAPEEDPYADNAPLKAALKLYLMEEDEEERLQGILRFLSMLAARIVQGAMVPAPFVDEKGALMKGINLDTVMVGDCITLEEEVRLKIDTMTDGEGALWIPLFLDQSEVDKGQTGNVILPLTMRDVLRTGMEWNDVQGVVVNPFGKCLTMSKELLVDFFSDLEKWEKEHPELVKK